MCHYVAQINFFAKKIATNAIYKYMYMLFLSQSILFLFKLFSISSMVGKAERSCSGKA